MLFRAARAGNSSGSCRSADFSECEYGESNSSLSLGKATRYHYAILAEIFSDRANEPGPRDWDLGMGVDLLDQDLLGGGADDLLADSASLEK
jgi:hypothetical protein